MSDYTIDAVLRMWDAGLDTAAIAKAMGQSQADVERWLHEGLERRRQK